MGTGAGQVSGGGVVVGTEGVEQPITLACVSLFSNRPGWCIIARMTAPDGSNVREWELTKQYKTPHGAMDVFSGFLRRQTVENDDL